MISILQEIKMSDYYHVERYGRFQFYVEDAQGGDETGPFETEDEAKKECDKRNKKRMKTESNISKLLAIFESEAHKEESEGYEAFMAGKKKTDCPYKKDDEFRKAWLEGWEKAEEDKEDE